MSLVPLESFESEKKVDVAIIGAGISGLYCAWRLIKQDRNRTITIVERLNRTGGRLDTDIVSINGDTIREEEGGMRFNYGMRELMTLNKALGLCGDIVEFPMGSQVDGRNTNRFQLRGRSFTVEEAEAGGQMIWSEIYRLKPEEVGLSPSDLVMAAYKNVLFANKKEYEGDRPPEFWTEFREKCVWNGKRMNQWQLWGLLRDMGYSEECITMLSETIGFAGPFKTAINAGDAFQILADFPKDPHYFTFRRGFSTLPNAIVKDLEDNHRNNVEILLSANVDSIARDDGGLELSITKAPELESSNPFIPGAARKSLRAKKVIIAVATSGMERLFVTSPALNDHDEAKKLWDNIHAARGMRLTKINLYFDKPWWQNGQTQRPPVQFGPNFTSLPVNAVYPFYSLEMREMLMTGSGGDGEIPDGAAALTIYCDYANTNFWNGLQNVQPPLFTSELQRRQSEKKPQTMFAASRAVVDEAKKQLGAVFDTNWVPEPVLTSYREWNGRNDFEYAYHLWRLNVMDGDVREYLCAPLPDIHFCNEAISDMHGWVNGSLRSSDLVLRHFGLDPMKDDPCEPKKTETETLGAGPGRRRTRGLWGMG